MVKRIYKLTEEEKEHITFVARLFGEIECDENITERFPKEDIRKVFDTLSWFLEGFEGEDYYTIDV